MVEHLGLDSARPLIICDADEVLVQFVAGLERFLERNACYLDLTSFRIHGNVKHRVSNEAVADETVSEFLKAFFASETRHLEAVPGAADALARLSAKAQIVILSNLPETAREARIENLAGHGIRFPVIAGKGPKGEIVKRMVAPGQRAVFVDDLPPHLASVAAETPHVHRLHFIADKRLARLLPPAPEAHRRIDDWPTAAEWIASVIDGQ
jgi:phosphoglycolate phosphatase-like HAD superfamily hydrolase